MDVTGEEMQLKGSRTLDPLQDLSMHVQMFSNFLGVFPVHYQELDPNRMALLYFVVGALDLLGNLSLVNKEAVIDWIYAQQVTSRISGQDFARCGFACGPLSGSKFDSLVESIDPSAHQYHESHIAMTYSALCVLKMLGDDFGRLDKAAIINSLKFFQLPNGSFRCLGRSSEDDMRFVFCACAISYILNDWTGFDTQKTTEFILNSQAFDGGFGLGPGLEGHGGSTYCAVASLWLMKKLSLIKHKEKLLKWCIDMQGSGFQGRPNKPPDSCYSYWIGATMRLLGIYSWSNPTGNREFIGKCAFKYGGFSKFPSNYPDVLHSFFSIAGLSLIGIDADVILSINPSVGISHRAFSSEIPDDLHWMDD